MQKHLYLIFQWPLLKNETNMEVAQKSKYIKQEGLMQELENCNVKGLVQRKLFIEFYISSKL